MMEFRAKLRPPRRTLWLGCKVSEVESKMSQISGRGYLLIRFENCPFLATWHHANHKWFRQAMAEQGIDWPELAIPLIRGDRINLDVRWEADPRGTTRDGEVILYPRPWIDIASVVELRK